MTTPTTRQVPVQPALSYVTIPAPAPAPGTAPYLSPTLPPTAYRAGPPYSGAFYSPITVNVITTTVTSTAAITTAMTTSSSPPGRTSRPRRGPD